MQIKTWPFRLVEGEQRFPMETNKITLLEISKEEKLTQAMQSKARQSKSKQLQREIRIQWHLIFD